MATIKVPYFKWRDGRPRWEPGPGLRRRGIKGQDLKSPHGEWLDEMAALRRARELNAEVAADLEAGAPRHRMPRPGTERTCEAAWHAFKRTPEWERLAASTRQDYDVKALIWLEEFGGLSVAAIQRYHMRDWWEELYRERGHAMANGTLAVARRALSYATLKGWLAINPALKLEIVGLPPRTMLITPTEVLALVRTADAMNLASVGDAVVLALHTGQRQGDVLGLQLHNIKQETEEWVDLRTAKTNVRVRVPATPVLKERLADMQRRRRADTVVSLAEKRLIIGEHGEPYKSDFFRKKWALVRAETATEVPAVASKQFLDLRDTAVTRLALAGCTLMQIRSITGHSLETVHQVLKHYLVLDDAMAKAAITQLTTWMEAEGIAI